MAVDKREEVSIIFRLRGSIPALSALPPQPNAPFTCPTAHESESACRGPVRRRPWSGRPGKDRVSTVPKPPPVFRIDSSPIDRTTPLTVSFAPVVKTAAESGVYISSTKRVRTNDMSQLFQDPLFRRFFGPMMPNQGQGGGGQYERQESLGSGVVVSANGYVITNNHVVEGADEVTVKFGVPEREFKATVVGRDAEADVAVIRIHATGLHAAILGDSDQLQVGDTVLAIGDPFGIGLTVTHGIVSAWGGNDLGIESFEDFIPTTIPSTPAIPGAPSWTRGAGWSGSTRRSSVTAGAPTG